MVTKVEELTLYAIEADRKSKIANERADEMEKKLKRLEELIIKDGVDK